MNTDEKYNLAMDISQKWGVDNKEDVISIAQGIKEDRFLVEYDGTTVALFLTWKDNLIDGKRYIFVNNCWVEPEYRNYKTLLKAKTLLKYILGDVYKFYWHNRKKNKMVYRR